MPSEEKFSGFVFKIQANMDPKLRDRIAFMRICSGRFTRGHRTRHVRLGREMKMANPIMFMANTRAIVEEAYPGDIVGIHDHGSIEIGEPSRTARSFTSRASRASLRRFSAACGWATRSA